MEVQELVVVSHDEMGTARALSAQTRAWSKLSNTLPTSALYKYRAICKTERNQRLTLHQSSAAAVFHQDNVFSSLDDGDEECRRH